jgi:phosphoglycerate dehydrogenase-like enzyme
LAEENLGILVFSRGEPERYAAALVRRGVRDRIRVASDPAGAAAAIADTDVIFAWRFPAELFAAADIVTLHLVLSDSTRGVVGRSALQSMKPGALLVNTARAGLVDTAALIEVLRSGHLGGAGIEGHHLGP